MPPPDSLGVTVSPKQLQFNDAETVKLRQIAAYYVAAKELIIYGEQIDPNHSTLSQTLNERVNAFDHLMRVVVEKQGMRRPPVTDPTKYNKDNLDKAYGHIFRAAYDALDWVALTIQERIAKDIAPFPLETLHAVLPEYFNEIKPKLEKVLHKDITKLRNEKDVSDTSDSNLQQYIRTVAELKDLFDPIEKRMASLVEYEHKRKREVWVDWGLKIAAGVIIGFLLAQLA